MKILIIQLTRLGDILCTLPTLTALRREYPSAQIHFLVRKSFAEAAQLSNAVDHFWYLDSEKIFSPIINEKAGKDSALFILSQTIRSLKNERFDKIINLSFSPSSSFVTHLISHDKNQVAGYSRTSDFYLSIPDEASRYFKAQVGLEKSNRMHVMDLFAWVSGITLKECDLYSLSGSNFEKSRLGVTCHLGASHVRKTWPIEYWMSLIRELTEDLNQNVTLIGGIKERNLSEQIVTELRSDKIVNTVGTTSLNDCVQVLKRSRLFIGVDSGPLHLASLAGCQSLNLSVGQVRFWETGPTVPGSRVLVKNLPHYLTPDLVFSEACSILSGENKSPHAFIAQPVSDQVRYFLSSDPLSDIDEWDVVRWLNFQGEAPKIEERELTGLDQLIEASEIALKQTTEFYKNPHKTEIAGILDRLDYVIEVVGTKLPKLSPLVDDFICEKSNIPPASRNEVFLQTEVCYRTLIAIAKNLRTISDSRKGNPYDQTVSDVI
jgi:heptosyltransferase-3